MRHLQPLRRVAAQAFHLSRQQSDSRYVGRFVAALEQPLHADANAQQRRARADRICDRRPPRLVEA
jgi:hypothetical protein